jgi:DNA-binding Lrp family transcriptional regulator
VSNKDDDNMINAYILINMKPGKTDNVIAAIRKIEDVAKISVVAGEYDIVVRAQVKGLDKLLKITDKIQMIDGVAKTTTQIIEKEITL